jgi:transposase-like protein
MAFRYPTPFREAACARMLAGERVEDLASELEVAAGTLYRWKAQALIDAGRKPRLGQNQENLRIDREFAVVPTGSGPPRSHQLHRALIDSSTTCCVSCIRCDSAGMSHAWSAPRNCQGSLAWRRRALPLLVGDVHGVSCGSTPGRRQ